MILRDKVALITGASEGLGEAIAWRLAKEGAEIWLVARSESKLVSVRDRINSAGMRANYCVCNVASPSDVKECVERIKQAAPSVDILINNAGIWLQGKIEDASSSQIERVFAVNTLGSIFVTQAILPIMINQNSGHIINILSDSAIEPFPEWAFYVASKYGARGFTDSLRKAVERTRLKVTSVYPGGINTNLFKNAGIELSSNEPWMMNKEDIADIVAHIVTRPHDIVIEHVVVRKSVVY